MAVSRACPCCDQETTRRRTPLWLKPLRIALGSRCSYRRCRLCGWQGLAFHFAMRSRPVESPAIR
jgi:hypothetical protein